MSGVGLVVQVAVFQLLEQNDFPTAAMADGPAAVVNNGIGIAVATLTNFLLNTTVTWNRRGRVRRFTYG